MFCFKWFGACPSVSHQLLPSSPLSLGASAVTCLGLKGTRVTLHSSISAALFCLPGMSSSSLQPAAFSAWEVFHSLPKTGSVSSFRAQPEYFLHKIVVCFFFLNFPQTSMTTIFSLKFLFILLRCLLFFTGLTTHWNYLIHLFACCLKSS